MNNKGLGANNPGKKVRWGVLGSAKINEKILPAIAASSTGELSVFGSRDSKRAQKYAQDMGFRKAVDSYDAVINSSDVDAIYISLPNDLHFEWCKKAIWAGKHVLCEKPIVLSSLQIQELLEMCGSKEGKPPVIVEEAFMYRHHDQTRGILDFLGRKTLGPIHDIQCYFGFTLSDAENIRLQKARGGGSLWDLGCYEVDLILQIAGVNGNSDGPAEYHATAKWNESGVDVDFWGEMIFENMVARFHSSFQTPRQEFMQITGEEGILRIQRPFKPGKHEIVEHIFSDKTTSIVFEDHMSPYARQIHDFQDAILAGAKSAFVSLESSLRTTVALEKLSLAALTGDAVPKK